MATINRGLVSTADPLSEDRVISMRKKIGELDVNTTQFFTMLDRISTEECRSFKEEWLEDEYVPTNLSLGASISNSATNLTLTSPEGDYCRVGDSLKILQTGEVVRVVAVNSSTAVDVVRAQGSVSAASATGGTTNGGLINLGLNAEQGQEAPTALVVKLTTNYNYTSIKRNSYRYTGTAQWIEWYSGPQLVRANRHTAINHKRAIENQLWFGGRHYVAGATGPRHTSGGILEYLSTNKTAVAGNLTKATLQTFLRTGLEYGSRDRKVLFVAPFVAQCIGTLMDDDWVQAPPNTKVYGVNVDTLISAAWAGATVPVVVKGEWNRAGTGTSNNLGSMAVLVDMTNVALKWAKNDEQGSRKVSLRKDRQAPSADEAMHEFLSEFTLVCQVEKSHALMTGVTGTA